MTKYAACPKCHSSESDQVKFTWWGGLLGPRLLNHVKCPRCGHTYNGKTGHDNTAGVVIYSVSVAIIVFGVLFFLSALLGFLMYFTNR